MHGDSFRDTMLITDWKYGGSQLPNEKSYIIDDGHKHTHTHTHGYGAGL